jgi:hypothetical protein
MYVHVGLFGGEQANKENEISKAEQKPRLLVEEGKQIHTQSAFDGSITC